MTQPVIGTVTIAPGVLSTIVSLTAQEVAGVSRLGTLPGNQRVGHLLDGTAANGVLVRVIEDAVIAECYIVAKPETNLVSLGQEVQDAVTQALIEMVGMPVRSVNVYIQDVEQRRGEA